jgi:glutathione S-transferase
MGDTYTVADIYLFTIANWSNYTGLDFAEFPDLRAFMGRMMERAAVVRAFKAERLIR